MIKCAEDQQCATEEEKNRAKVADGFDSTSITSIHCLSVCSTTIPGLVNMMMTVNLSKYDDDVRTAPAQVAVGADPTPAASRATQNLRDQSPHS